MRNWRVGESGRKCGFAVRWLGGAGLALMAAGSAFAAVAPIGGQNQINTAVTLSQSRADVAVAAWGDAVVVWQSAATVSGGTDVGPSISIQGQRFDRSGLPAGTQFQVNVLTTNDQQVPAAAMSPDGRFLLVWQGFDAQSEGVRARLFGADGTPLTDEFLVNTLETGAQIEPDVAWLASGNFLVVWQSYGSPGNDAFPSSSVQGRLFSGTGTAVGGQFQINTAIAGNQGFPTVAAQPGGSAFVAWTSDDVSANPPRSIRVRKLSAAGALLGSELTTISGTDSIGNPAVASGTDGAALVVWSRSVSALDTNGYTVEAQLVNSLGSSLTGATILVPQNLVGEQVNPSVAALPSGGYQVAWETQDAVGDDPGRAIATISLGANGLQADDEMQVNTYTAGDQQRASVAFGPNGAGWMVWESNGSSGSDTSLFSIQGQRFRDDQAPLIFLDGFE